jgi:hypothetical protein
VAIRSRVASPCKHGQLDRQRQDQPDQRPRIDRGRASLDAGRLVAGTRQPQRRGHAQHHGQ